MGASARLRLLAWPVDPTVGQLVVTDQHAVPNERELAEALLTARREGYRALRTGALFPHAAEAMLRAGFRTIDTLVLLQRDLDDAPARPATRPLHRWQHEAAAGVDQRAFGDPWGNDAAGIAAIRAATPAHRARWIGERGRIQAFAITGAGGRVGYLQRLAVDPAQQRRGLGRALAEDALSWMRGRSLTSAMVNTGADNTAARALYEGLGFRLTRERLIIAELDLQPPAS